MQASSTPSLYLQFARGWDKFWFSKADPTPLGLIRLCAGAIIFYTHLAYSYDLLDLFGPAAWVDLPAIIAYRDEVPHYLRSEDWKELPDYRPPTQADAVLGKKERDFILTWEGMHPSTTYSQGFFAWSIFFHLHDPTWIWVVHGANLVVFFLFAIGCCTRVTSVLAWLAGMSYIQRSPVSLFGQDTMSNLLMMYLMIGPSGAALSVDALIRRLTANRRGQGAADGQTADIAPTASVSANLALRLLQVHFCFIYLAAGLSKLQGTSWWNGTALWATLANPEFAPVHLAPYHSFLRFLCEHRWLWEIVMTGGVFYTLALEISFPFLVWDRRLRWLMVIGSVLLHTGITLFMGLSAFSLLMVTIVFSFVPAERIRRVTEPLEQLVCGLFEQMLPAVRPIAQTARS